MNKNMKKVLAGMLAGGCIFSMAACGSAPIKENTAEETIPTEAEEVIDGGIILAKSPEITPEITALMKKAVQGTVGAIETPVAYIGSQAAAGTNYFVLCSERAVPTAQAYYVFVTLHEDLEGKAKIVDVWESGLADPRDAAAEGNWQSPDSPQVTQEAAEALEKAVEGQVGVRYRPLALLATQAVSGTNYSLLCQAEAVVPDPVPEYYILQVYEDLEGNAEIMETYDFIFNE